ncbi:MAG: hypothetical protein IJC80_01980, partial [Clostridia bacterium]|nr:hypothetical protein [Clostridia bacterium]
MNKTKRFLGLFLVVFMLLAFVPLQALANTVDEIAPVGSDSQTTEVASATDETLPDGVTADSFGDNTVTDGTNYYADLQTAVEAVCGVNNAVLYCKPSADVGSLQHAPVISSLTIYGNGASVTGGAERDFDIGNTDPSLGKDVTGDMTLKVVSLNGCGAWGAKATEHTVNLVFENCQNMGKVFLTGTTGTLNISITDCAFEGVIAEAIYSNANGDICVSGVEFSNLNKAINLNHKAEGEQNITIENCTFTNCGNDVSADQIPVRVLSSVEGGVSVLTVSGCTFTGTPEGGADILLDYNANGTTVYDITSTTAGVLLENENGNGVITNVNADADFSNKQGYLIYIYNADGSIGMVINSTKSASEFCLRTAIEDARVFVDNAFLFGITTPATYVVEMYEDSTENESFEIGSDVTINGNGFEIVCADGVEVTVAEGATLNNVVMPEAPAAPVASINGVEYADLQAAIDAASNGDTIVLLGNITLVSQEFTYPNYNRLGYCGVVIPDGKQLVLDLAGYTVSYSDAYGDFDNCMIINIGDLTINDTVGSGKIYYHANNNELATATYAYLHATILNGGKLVLNEGVTVENYAPADVDVTAALDNHSHFSYSYENDAICIINGANLISNKYFAIRQYTHYKTGYANDVTINDGTVTAIYLQHGDSWYYPDPADERLARATLTINGGTIKTLQAAEDWTCPAVRMAMSNPDNPNIQLSITGGVIDDVKIAVRRGYHYNENGTLVNETTADRNTEWLAANGGFITGGTFTNIGSADDITTNLVSFLADGFELVENADGTYGVNELPTGTLTNAYTSASGYWGECGGNAKESFGFKLYYNDTFMGSTFLNNVGGIIDGDVYVSWNIKLDAESNTDEYWTMSWEIAPTIAMQPNRVEQWVDGVCVANVELEPNWSDRIFPVVAAVTDADGKILSYVNNYDGATLANAFANANEGDEVVLLADVAFAENAASIVINKAITIDGNGKQLTFDSATSAFVIQSSNVTIKNVTIVQGAKDNSFAISISKGAWDAPAIQYSNITISEVDFVGGDYALCLIGENVVVDGCTFTEQDSHNVIVYSLKGESAITNNVFNASNGNNKSAILWEGGADNATDLSGFIAG